jgi:hypothetical protein
MDLRDQDLTLLRSEARRRFQVMIDYIKEQVGEGYEYANDLVRVVLSDRGCYYEFRNMPEEFSGAVGSGFQHEFVTTATGLALMEQIHQLVLQATEADTRELSLLCIYGHDALLNRENTYVHHRSVAEEGDEGPVTIGNYRPGVLPLFFKLKVDSDLALPFLGAGRGVLFFVANLTDQHLLVRIPHQGPGVTDLNHVPASQMIH